VCPTGWHVPTDSSWTVFTTFLEDNGYGYGGMGADIGKSMASTYGWETTTVGGAIGNDQGTNNSSGFTGLPGGNRYYDGTFDDIGSGGYWWCSTELNTANGWDREPFYSLDGVNRDFYNKGSGMSVRCLRD
jgi:uncharacterized protein (TIGR02145 family)